MFSFYVNKFGDMKTKEKTPYLLTWIRTGFRTRIDWSQSIVGYAYDLLLQIVLFYNFKID